MAYSMFETEVQFMDETLKTEFPSNLPPQPSTKQSFFSFNHSGEPFHIILLLFYSKLNINLLQ